MFFKSFGDIMPHGTLYAQDGRMYIRKSMLEEFSFCPYKFKRVWIDNLEKRANQAMLIGTRFHDFAEKFFDYCLGLDPEQWDEFIPREFIPEEAAMAKWFIERERLRYYDLQEQNRLNEFMPIAREDTMTSNSLLLTSTMDRADWYNKSKNHISIIEYKTGKKINEDSLIRQLAFYTLLWNEVRRKGIVVNLQLINPRLQVVRNFTVQQWHLDKAMKEISKLRAAMKNNDYPRKCSDVKLAFCQLCTPDECGFWKNVTDTPIISNFDNTFTFTKHRSDENELHSY
jgi:CRISPR/Cas system-associated exonuclease Cas4 (RecB family)